MNKLLSILKEFSKIELNRLRKYLNSPYFNKNKDILALYTYLEKLINTKKTLNLDKEKAWKYIFKTMPYNDGRYRKLNSDLLKQVENFLAQELYNEDNLNKATYLIKAVRKKKLEKLHNTTMNMARRLSERQNYQNATFYFNQYNVERHYYELSESELNRSTVSNVEAIINNLDHFYLAEKLRYYCEALSRKNVISHEYQLLFIDEIIEYLGRNNANLAPPVAVYYQMYLTQAEPENEAHYYKLKGLIDEYILKFPTDEAKSLYTNAINYCIKKINIGNQVFLEEFLNLNEELLKKGILGEGELSPWKFKNIVSAALRLGRYEWTENFINTYCVNIAEAFRENAVTFNLANLYFYQKDYEKTIETLREVEYEDFTYNLNSKTILLASYYEIDEQELLYFLFDSFRVYLNRNKNVTAQRKVLYMNLIKFTKKLTKIMPKDKVAIAKLKEEIDATTTGIASEKWLREKIAELEF